MPEANNDIALFKFGFGTRHFIALKSVLTDQESQLEIRRQYRDYKRLARRLFPYVDIKNKIRFMLFFMNLDLYGLVREEVAKRKGLN